MSSSRLILAATCALALSAPAWAQQPPVNTGQVLTQEYARLYREFLDKKKLGLDADAATKYAEFLAAFRKHRLISRLGLQDPIGNGGSGGPADDGGGNDNPNGGNGGGSDSGGGVGGVDQGGGGDTGITPGGSGTQSETGGEPLTNPGGKPLGGAGGGAPSHPNVAPVDTDGGTATVQPPPADSGGGTNTAP